MRNNCIATARRAPSALSGNSRALFALALRRRAGVAARNGIICRYQLEREAAHRARRARVDVNAVGVAVCRWRLLLGFALRARGASSLTSAASAASAAALAASDSSATRAAFLCAIVARICASAGFGRNPCAASACACSWCGLSDELDAVHASNVLSRQFAVARVEYLDARADLCPPAFDQCAYVRVAQVRVVSPSHQRAGLGIPQSPRARLGFGIDRPGFRGVHQSQSRFVLTRRGRDVGMRWHCLPPLSESFQGRPSLAIVGNIGRHWANLLEAGARSGAVSREGIGPGAPDRAAGNSARGRAIPFVTGGIPL